MAAVWCQGLRKAFGRVRALDGLTLTVEEGVVFGFLGPNGAGKTTAIRVLTGLARAGGGHASVAGVEVGRERDRLARSIGYLPEEPAFYAWMSPREYLDYVGRIFGLSGTERAERSRELLALTGLQEAARRRIGGFSRGMRQRLGIAQALVNRPRVLFLDEPASALDPSGRREVLELIDRLRGQTTVVMSTHILADVERVCDSVGIIARGRMVTVARRDELMARYAVPAFEIETENGQVGVLRAWAERLRSEAYVDSVVVDGPTARVVVNDTEAAKRALPAAAVTAGLVMLRYEMVRPSLEDIFLRLVDGEGVAA